MRKLVEDGFAIHYIARKFECRANAVWFHVFDLIPPQKLSKEQQKRNLRGSNLTISKVQRIRKMGVKDKIPANAIARIFGISNTAALSIIKGRTFRWIPGETLSGEIIPIEYEYTAKTDRKRGPKMGSKKRVRAGVLKKYGKIHGVDASTVCKWVKQGKLLLPPKERIV